MRLAFFGLASALLLAACGSAKGSCDPTSCATGCCDASGQCQPSTNLVCGTNGVSCVACPLGQACLLGVCTANSTGGGGGSSSGGGGGATGGGGGATGGGTATGGGGASTGGGGGATDGGLTATQLEWLTAHDRIRDGAMPAPSPALPHTTWSTAAAAQAENWAANCTFEHRQPNSMGENLYASTNSSSPTSVVNSWASEVADYDYATNTCAAGKACGHYTQVVWRTSTGIGCAQKLCTTNSPFGSGSWYLVVCNYTPAGNYVGRKPY